MIMVYSTDKQRLNIAKQQYVDTEIDGHVWVDVDCNPVFHIILKKLLIKLL